jgi:hypothetical protein
LLKITDYNQSGVITCTTVLEYDANKQIIKCSSDYPATPDSNMYYSYEYLLDGDIKMTSYKTSDDSIISWSISEFDTNSLTALETFYNADGSVNYTMGYEYDTSRRLLKVTYDDPSFSIFNEYYLYEYLVNGNVKITKYKTSDNSIMSWSMCEYN